MIPSECNPIEVRGCCGLQTNTNEFPTRAEPGPEIGFGPTIGNIQSNSIGFMRDSGLAVLLASDRLAGQSRSPQLAHSFVSCWRLSCPRFANELCEPITHDLIVDKSIDYRLFPLILTVFSPALEPSAFLGPEKFEPNLGLGARARGRLPSAGSIRSLYVDLLLPLLLIGVVVSI